MGAQPALQLVKTDEAKPLTYDTYPEFNEWLDGRYPEGLHIDMEGVYFSQPASRILWEMDPIQYQSAYNVYQTEQLEIFKDVIFEQFPTPIAYYFYRAERGYETQKQRLEFLRDTWEALIFLLFALVVGEARHRELSLEGIRLSNGNLRRSDFYADSLYKKLDIILAILECSEKKNIPMASRAIVPKKALEKVRQLNQARNGFSHSAAISEEQARRLYSEHYQDVLDVLRRVTGLQNVTLLRYIGTSDKATVVRCEVFRGSRMVRVIDPIELTTQQLVESAAYLTSDSLLVLHEDKLYNLFPFLHFVVDPSGHRTDLCFFKQRTTPVHTYEVIGRAEEIELQDPRFQQVADSLLKLLQNSGA